MTQEILSRRRVIQLFAVVGGGMLAEACGPSFSPDFSARSQYERINFLSKIAEFRSQIEDQKTGEQISLMTKSHDVLAATGAALYHQPDFFDAYWKAFSSDLQGQGPNRGQYTPKFWETIVKAGGGKAMPLGDTLSELVDRLNQWTVYFGSEGNQKTREKNRTDLVIAHRRRMIDPAGNATALLEYERVQLERDIGKFILAARELSSPRSEELKNIGNGAIGQWIDKNSATLSQASNYKPDQIGRAAFNSNPYSTTSY